MVAGRSSAVSEDDRRRLESLGDRISLHVVDAGHWLHMEAADQLLQLFSAELTRLRPD